MLSNFTKYFILLTLIILPVFTFGFRVSCSPCSCYISTNFCGSGKKGVLSDIPNNVDKNSLVLDLAANKFTDIKANHFIGFLNLEEINMCYNEINTIHPNSFKNKTKLKSLNLNNNLIHTLPENLFIYTPAIFEISLSCNKISVLNKNLFANLKYLQIIRIMNNQITFIESGSFSNLPSLNLVDLSYNRLTYLQINILEEFKKFKNFALHGNPWNCNKELCPVMNSFSGSTHFSPHCKNGNYKKWNELLLDFSPSIKINKAYITEGDDVKIHCEYCFANKIIWKYNGAEMNFEDLVFEENVTSTLTFLDVNIIHSGIYSCKVKDCLNCKEAGTYLIVNRKTATTAATTTTIKERNITITANRYEDKTADLNSVQNTSENQFGYVINLELNMNSTGFIEEQDNNTEIILLDYRMVYNTETNINKDFSQGIINSSMVTVLLVFVPGVIIIILLTICMLWSSSHRPKINTNIQDENNYQPLIFQYVSDPVPFPPPEQEFNTFRYSTNNNDEQSFFFGSGENHRNTSSEIIGVA